MSRSWYQVTLNNETVYHAYGPNRSYAMHLARQQMVECSEEGVACLVDSRTHAIIETYKNRKPIIPTIKG